MPQILKNLYWQKYHQSGLKETEAVQNKIVPVPPQAGNRMRKQLHSNTSYFGGKDGTIQSLERRSQRADL